MFQLQEDSELSEDCTGSVATEQWVVFILYVLTCIHGFYHEGLG